MALDFLLGDVLIGNKKIAFHSPVGKFMDQLLAVAAILAFGALAFFVHHWWLRNASSKISLYVAIGGACCMAALLVLGSAQVTMVTGILMALLFALVISLRYRTYRRSAAN